MTAPSGTRSEAERSIRAIQKTLISKGFQTPEELERFLNEHLVAKPLDELAAMIEEEEPQTDLDRAEQLMDELPAEATPAEVRRTAKAALKLSEECLGAWLVLGVHEEKAAKALVWFDQGIEKGRARFADLIDSLDAEYGMWGWIEARDFMRLLHQRAIVLEELGKLDQAVTAYQEMLTLNPGDNQGVRDDLLLLLMIFRRLEDGRALLDRFPKDTMPAMAYGRALLSFVETMDRTGFELPDMETPGTPQTPSAVMKRLGPEFDMAKKHLKQAVKLNPFVPWMMTHPQIMGVNIAEMVMFGGPYEAASYAQKWALIWYASVLPFFGMTAAMQADPMRHAKSKCIVEELQDVLGELESLGDMPWWKQFELGA